MYKVKQIYNENLELSVPTCMYKVKPACSTAPLQTSPESGSGTDSDECLQALERRQDAILERLQALQQDVQSLCQSVCGPGVDEETSERREIIHKSATNAMEAPSLESILGKHHGAVWDLVINANPASPPLSLLVLYGLLKKRYRVLGNTHVHSSVRSISSALRSCLGGSMGQTGFRQEYQMVFTLIWKDVAHPELRLGATVAGPIEGEGNIARFLFGLLSTCSQDPEQATIVDTWVDRATSHLLAGDAKRRAAAMRLLAEALDPASAMTTTESSWLVGRQLSVADIMVWSALVHSGHPLPSTVSRWVQTCETFPEFMSARSIFD
uniref:Aminoacyl tRNA synthetase complex interacting multifunctional protein 2 n=1 Tax=Eptatretus burgeri TaxID=7764 RepID=A0A8C4QLN5_EPTBU